MNPIRPRFGACKAASAVALLLTIPGLQASQLLYEGFNYPAGATSLTGQTGGSGWNGAWQTVNNGSADVVTGSLVATGAASPTGYDARSAGNSSFLTNGKRVGRFVDTSATGVFGAKGYRDANGKIGADGKTIYISFMQQPNSTDLYYEFEFHRGNLGDGGRIGGIGNDQGGGNVNLRAPNNAQSIIGAGSTGVNFYVVRIDFKAGNDDVYVYRNPTSTTEPAVPTLTKLAVADMSFDGISFGAFVNGLTVAHDEVRMGESWADVTVPPNAAPVFTTQPKTTTTSYAGGSVTLTAEATGQPAPTYQWFKGITPISGQTSSTLTLTNVQAGDAASYHATATNSQATATSNNAQVTVVAAPAGLLAYEGFDYTTSNTNGKAGGLGWSAPWTAVDGSGGSIQSGSLAAGTNAPNGYDAQSLSNSDFMPNGTRDGRVLDTSPTGLFGAAGYVDGLGNIGADGKTVYISFLQQPDGATKFYEFELHRGSLGDPGRIGGIGNDTGNPTVALRTGNAQNVIGTGNTGVNFYVVRIDFKAGNDDVYVYQNPISATEPGTPTYSILGASDMSFNGISLAAFDNGRTVKHDEIRLGKSWSDVVFGTSRRQLVWTGDGVTNAWNFAANNWNAGAGPTAFVDGDPVTFNDSGSATPAVNLATTVSTGSITVDNGTKNYTIGGTGTVNVSGGLAKTGSGSLTLSATANFNSALVIDGGDLNLNGTTAAGGGLNINSGTTTIAGTTTLGPVITTNGNVLVKGPATISGPGAVAWFANLEGANSTLTLQTGGSLTMTTAMADSWVIGRDGGIGVVNQTGGTITYNPPNRPDAFIGASTSPTTTGDYNLSGGTLDMSTKNLVLALGPVTSHVTQTGGTLNVGGMVLGRTLNGSGDGTGIYSLSSGSLTVGAGGISSGTSLYEFHLTGGTIGASANWTGSVDMGLDSGTEIFDTGAFDITLNGTLSGTGALAKNGTGALILGGFNSYTGATTVNAGTIGGSGPGDTSVLSLVTGTKIAPGDPAASAVANFYVKSVTMPSGSTLQIDIDAEGASADQLSATGAINITGATATFTEVFPGTLTTGTNLIIVQAGTTVTGTFAGLPEGATVSAGGNNFAIHYQPSRVILTVTGGSPYNTWAAAHGLDGTAGKDPAFTADPENDGVINGLEWILGGDPLAQDSSTLVTTTGSASTGLTLGFKRIEASLGATTLTVQYSTDLVNWTDVPVVQAGGTYAGGVTVTVNQTATPDTVSVAIPASNAVGGKIFARVKATMP